MEPLVFTPYFRPQIWGGRGFTRLGKSLPDVGKFGESWEVSAHPHHISCVAEGPLRGVLLTELWRDRRTEIDGPPATTSSPTDSAANNNDAFPWLFKLLDCQELLSVQVHPNDATAAEMHARGEIADVRGKTEAWVVLHAESTARIYAGLRPGVDRAELERSLDRGAVAECLHSFTPRSGDCVMLHAGTVHAVGGGVLMAEVQQTSDATFRLFDWNRVDANGQPRTLHRQQSLAAINWIAGPVSPVVGRPLDVGGDHAGVRGELLAACPYFELRRYFVGQRLSLPSQPRMSIAMVLSGELQLSGPGPYEHSFHAGATVLLPAGAEYGWRNRGQTAATLLTATMPLEA